MLSFSPELHQQWAVALASQLLLAALLALQAKLPRQTKALVIAAALSGMAYAIRWPVAFAVPVTGLDYAWNGAAAAFPFTTWVLLNIQLSGTIRMKRLALMAFLVMTSHYGALWMTGAYPDFAFEALTPTVLHRDLASTAYGICLLWKLWRRQRGSMQMRPLRRGAFSLVAAAGFAFIGLGLSDPFVVALRPDLLSAQPASATIVLLFALSLYFNVAFAKLAVGRLARGEEGTFAGAGPTPSKVGERLMALMNNERPYLDPELKFADVCRLLKVSAVELRTCLSSELGFENFKALVNHHRVEYAASRLVDPDKQTLTISALGFEAGFNSVSTFNRAFLAVKGVTPSQFRHRALYASEQAMKVQRGGIELILRL